MTSHHLTIAKASFAAACLRPDATNLTRDELSAFHTLLETTVLRCSPHNIQACKQWLLQNIVPSPLRSAALGKYLVSFSGNTKDEAVRSSSGGRGLSATRQILHILYLLNDVLHHAKYHTTDHTGADNLGAGLQSQVSNLFQQAATGDKKRVDRRLEDLLRIWERESYFPTTVTEQLRKQTSSTERSRPASIPSQDARPLKELPYMMPATHGDPTMPYYDLPAANIMPHIVPNKPIPVRADQIRALHLSSGPADESLINAVKDFMKDVERMENPYQSLEDEGIVADMDELGQLSYRNETDEIIGDTYYGWSRGFCDKMKKRGFEESDNGRGDTSVNYNRNRSRSFSRSRSRSRSRSETPPKRRKYDSSSRSHSRSRNRPRLGSRSRSRSPYRPSQAVLFKSGSPSLPPQFQLPSSIDPRVPSTSQHLPHPPFPVLGPNGPMIPPRPADHEGIWPPPPPPPPPPPGRFPDVPLPLPPPPHAGSRHLPHFKQ